MRYIKSFANDAAIQAAVNDGVLGKPYVALDDQTHKIDWDSKERGPAYQYLTIEALESGDLKVYNPTSVVYYSMDNGEWVSLTPDNHTISLNVGNKVRFKHNGANGNYNLFVNNTIAFNVYGNIESLEYGDNFVGQTEILQSNGAFKSLFRGSTGLVSAENLILPATTLKPQCYGDGSNSGGMFSGCTSLTTAPALPATTLATQCYANMFWNCTSLTKAPELLYNGNLPEFAYYSMFRNCDSLTYVKCLANPGNNADYWLEGIDSTGTLVKKSGANWQTFSLLYKYGIPSKWTVVNAS